MVERSERYASVAKPEEHQDTKRRVRTGRLGEVLNAYKLLPRAERPTGEARAWNTLVYIDNGFLRCVVLFLARIVPLYRTICARTTLF